jgi:GNAT superfamily N-acetyltransferase
MDELSIEQIRHELTWRLRQKILYPRQKLYEMEMDKDLEGIHFGAFQNNELIAVVSLFPNGNSFQFRKFAVDSDYQYKGIGSKVLNYMTNFAEMEGAALLWCNARLSAIPFYLKHGFKQTGQLFAKNGFDYEVLEKSLIRSSDQRL